MTGNSSSSRQAISAAATIHLGYEEAEAMLRDILSPDLISGTAIRVARDHMVQFARRLPAQLPADREPRTQACGSPLGQSAMFCARESGHAGTCAAIAADDWNKGWIGQPPALPELLGPLDDEQFAVLLSTIDAKTKAAGTDTLELAWLLTIKLEIMRLRVEADTLHNKLSCHAPRVETAAVAIAMNRYRNHKPPVRWPNGPDDIISGRDGTVPITWDAAQQFREDARAALGALPEGGLTTERDAGRIGEPAAIIAADRDRAWPFRPACYPEDAATREAWMDGKYDSAAPIIASFRDHRQFNS